MTTKTVDVRDVQKRLNELLSPVAAGNEVILRDGVKPLARLVPLSSSRTAGLHPGAIQTTDDFDEPLSLEQVAHIYSPHLARQEQSSEFEMEVTERLPDE